MKSEVLKNGVNYFLTSRGIEPESLDVVPKIRHSFPRISLKKLPKLNLGFDFKLLT